MPRSTEASLHREGDALVFTGALLRGQAPALWSQALGLADGIRRLDLSAVERLDSAGLALLSALAAHIGGGVTVTGDPPGLDALRAVYRLEPALGFAGRKRSSATATTD